ncbi:hypothetical protein [Actinopolymorpha alba]|uniref:hypothetical protein n=1 Tax=Actinopolymorpha alba TaxID=533267 RepID=UPI0003758094|nr:hypothetical protein [Actinopolymorpha alba]
MRTIQLTERVPAPDLGRVPLALAGALGLGYLALLVAALVPWAGLFLAAAVVVTGLEIVVPSRAAFAGWTFGRAGASASWRGLLGAVAVLILLVREDSPAGWFLVAVGGLLATALLRALGTALGEVVRRQRKMPVVTRGLSLAPVRIPPAPHPLLGQHAEATLGWPGVLLSGGSAVTVLAGSVLPLVVGAALATLVVAAGAGALAYSALGMRRVTRPRLQAAVNRALEKAAPEVALYFGGTPETLYQLEMWVETLERLDVPSLLILRDRESLRQLGPTRLPVLCVEHGNVLMAQALPHLRVAMYVSHAVSNLHLLRRRGVRHVFIGHGDSDKGVTTNPFLKAYDEVWVSGPAARERFRVAATGVDDSGVVEIGRPQLDVVAALERPQPESEEESKRLTVLYAPTWEGYGDEPHQTSVGPCGVTLVRQLLEESDVRVLYRPHPLAGTRDPAVARAHQEILELLGVSQAPVPVGPQEAYTWARDDLEVAVAPVHTSRAEQVAALEVWAAKQLTPDPDRDGHLLVPSPQFSLYACFAAADLLLCDVSSVISDFLASGRPYAVTNPASLPATEFAVRYPSSRGGYLVEPDGHGLTGLLAAGRAEADPAESERVLLREQLLGPADPPALERMRKAVAQSVSFVT